MRKLLLTVVLSWLLIFGVACGGTETETMPPEDEAETTTEQEPETEGMMEEEGDHYAEVESDSQAEEGGDSTAGPADHSSLEVPEEYATMSNPFAGDQAAIEAGETIYQNRCASCHGPEGEADGPLSDTLDPPPTSLADPAMMSDVSDNYIFWRVSEGGQMEPFNSMMPAHNELLSEEEMWQVTNYVRSLSE